MSILVAVGLFRASSDLLIPLRVRGPTGSFYGEKAKTMKDKAKGMVMASFVADSLGYLML